MNHDFPLLSLAGIRTVRVEALGRPGIFLPSHSIALIDSTLNIDDEVAVIDQILRAAVERAAL